MGPRPSPARAPSVACNVDATHDADRAPAARQVVSNTGVGAMLAAGLAGGRIPRVTAGGGGTIGAGGTTGGGSTTGAGGGGAAPPRGGGGGGGGAAATAASGGEGVVVVGAGGGGVVVGGALASVPVAFSVSRILDMARTGASLRTGRGAEG